MSEHVLPRGWSVTTIDKVAAPIPNAIVDGPFGSNLKLDDYVDEGVPVLQGKNITNDSFRWFDVRFVSALKANELKRSSVRVGDILLVKIGSIGYSAVIRELHGFDFAIIPANLAKITPNPAVVDTGYLHKWLTSLDAKRYLKNAASKTAQPALSLGKIKNLHIPLPPLAEQRRIAEVLDRAEALRAKRRAALAQLDDLTQAIFLDLFGNPTTNSKGWPLKCLKDLGKVTTGGTPPSVKEGMFNGPIPFVTPGDLESDSPVKRSVTEAGAAETRTVRVGATLVCCIGATIGKAGKAMVRSAFNQQLNAVEWGAGVNDDYGLAVLRFFKPTIVGLGASTTLPILKKSAFERIEVPVPQLQIQTDFARRIAAVDTLKAAHRASLAEMDALFAALQHRAFRGEL